jgi:hypothetical protein
MNVIALTPDNIQLPFEQVVDPVAAIARQVGQLPFFSDCDWSLWRHDREGVIEWDPSVVQALILMSKYNQDRSINTVRFVSAVRGRLSDEMAERVMPDGVPSVFANGGLIGHFDRSLNGRREFVIDDYNEIEEERLQQVYETLRPNSDLVLIYDGHDEFVFVPDRLIENLESYKIRFNNTQNFVVGNNEMLQVLLGLNRYDGTRRPCMLLVLRDVGKNKEEHGVKEREEFVVAERVNKAYAASVVRNLRGWDPRTIVAVGDNRIQDSHLLLGGLSIWVSKKPLDQLKYRGAYGTLVVPDQRVLGEVLQYAYRKAFERRIFPAFGIH